MKQLIVTGVAALLLLTACGAKNGAPQLRSQQDTLSWALGENIALSMKETGRALNLDDELVMQAIRHTLAGKPQPLDNNQLALATDRILFEQQTEIMRQENQSEAQINEQQDQYFAQLEKDHPNVKKHPSGFYYEQVKAGKGRNVREGDRVSFDYRSFLMFTGEPYDQTYGKREPILHVVGKPMFQGLIEGMQVMNAGSIYRFYFPYQLAFGSQGSGNIAGFTPFIYEVELHEIFDY